MGLETQMWRFLRPELHRAGLETERLTDRLATARPDVLWIDTYDGLTGLCELKAPKPRQKDLGLRPGQAAFCWDWVEQRKGLASILVRYPGDMWSLFYPARHTIQWIAAIESEMLPSPNYHWQSFPGGSAIREALRNGRQVVPTSPTGENP